MSVWLLFVVDTLCGAAPMHTAVDYGFATVPHKLPSHDLYADGASYLNAAPLPYKHLLTNAGPQESPGY